MLDKSTSRLPLHCDSDLHQVFPAFLIDQFDYARALESGLILGLDPEYNHQYRVTLRRIRSLCKLLKELVSPFELSTLKPKLSLLMKQTNLLRDLDVFINDKSKYLALLPDDTHTLEKIFANIEEKQTAQQDNVAKWLSSQEYKQTSVLVRNSLKRAVHHEHQTGLISPKQFANEKIHAQLNKVAKASKKISQESEDDVIHSLRIKCKALRYLLECFSSLYDSPQHQQNVKHLKRLQDKLGDFNDTSTQIVFFSIMRKTATHDKADLKVLKRLIKQLKHQHELSRQSIFDYLRQFEIDLMSDSALLVYQD